MDRRVDTHRPLSGGGNHQSTSEGMESIKRSLKARKRRKTINEQKRSKEIPQSGMSNGYGEIEQRARLLVRACADCKQSEDIMTYAKQACAFITQKSGRDFIRLRFIQLLLHAIAKYSDAAVVPFRCSTCLGYAGCKFSEDTEVVKEPKLEKFLEQMFGVRADIKLPPIKQTRQYSTPTNDDESEVVAPTATRAKRVVGNGTHDDDDDASLTGSGSSDDEIFE